VIQRREQLRFPLEAGDPLLVFEELFRQDLDRDLPAEAGVSRAVDLSHPSRAKRTEDFVGAETGSGRETQSPASLDRQSVPTTNGSNSTFVPAGAIVKQFASRS
jgi:hypothetical protein